MQSKGNRCFGEGGFTLIEILIVLGIISLILGMGASTIGGFSTVKKMKEEALKFYGRVKYVYYEAAAESRYYRMVFNLDEQEYHVEFSEEPFYVVREGDELEELRKKNEERNSDDDSLFGEDEESGDSEDGEEEDEPGPPPEASDFAESEDDLLEIFSIPSGMRLMDAYVAHQKEKITEGMAYLYFFPRGQTEFAVFHLVSDEDEDDVFSLIVNPLNGTVEIRDEYVDHEDLIDEMNGGT